MKTLITFLGNNNYEPTKYKINDEIFILITESRFILYFSLNIKKQKTIAIFLSVGKFIITNFAANLYKVLNDK